MVSEESLQIAEERREAEVEQFYEDLQDLLELTNTLFQQHKRRLYTWTSPDGQH